MVFARRTADNLPQYHRNRNLGLEITRDARPPNFLTVSLRSEDYKLAACALLTVQVAERRERVAAEVRPINEICRGAIQREGGAERPPHAEVQPKPFKDKSIGWDDICAALKISKSKLYRYVVIGGVDPKSAKNAKRLSEKPG